jgi:hypothetical protein
MDAMDASARRIPSTSKVRQSNGHQSSLILGYNYLIAVSTQNAIVVLIAAESLPVLFNSPHVVN